LSDRDESMKISKWFERALGASFLVTALMGCGGGGSDAGCSRFAGCGTTTATPDVAVVPDTLLLSLSASAVKNTDTAPVVATAQVVNANGQAIAGVTVSFQVEGAVGPSSTAVTDASGRTTAAIDYTSDRTNRQVRVTASVGNLSDVKTFNVSGVKIASTLFPAIIQPGQTGSIEVDVSDANSNPLNDMPVSISAGAVTFVQASPQNTVSGKVSYSYSVPAGFTGTSISFAIGAGGVTQQQTVSVQQPGSVVVIQPAVGPIDLAELESSKTAVEVNSDGGTSNQAELRLKLFKGNTTPLPIPNVRVSFDLAGDPLRVGGRFTSGTSTVYSTAGGIASTTFIPAALPTGTNQLQIRACYSLTDFTPSPSGDAAVGSAACPNARFISVTLTDPVINISIGPEGTVGKTEDGRYYTDFVVSVANATGEAKANVAVSPTLDLLGFEKGFWTKPASGDWAQVLTSGGLSYPDPKQSTINYDGCANEDGNRDGVRSAGEDKDGDAKLEPAKAEAIWAYRTSARTTDSSGSVVIRVTYFRDVASWLRVKLSVGATVSGTEGVGEYTLVLLPPITDVQAEGRPAFADNRYGRSNSCLTH
jgi:hypothetical protein